jgi:general secretion pathway protein C
MGLNLSERYLTAFNVLLIAGIAYFSALSVNDVLKSRSYNISLGASLPAARLAAEVTNPRPFYDQIVQRNIFVPPQQEVAPAPPPPVDLHLKLLGTSFQTKDKPEAIIMDERSSEQSLYRLGDDIPDAGKLVAVEKNRVYIDVSGNRIALEIPADAMTSPESSPIFSPAARIGRRHRGGRPVRRRRANHYDIDRSFVNSSLQNITPFLGEMRALPDQSGHGFKLSEIQTGSVFQQLGLRDGDVVQTINGQSLSDPASAIQLLNSLRGSNSVGMVVSRSGMPIQFTYEIQ